jgi:hypothetical protein
MSLATKAAHEMLADGPRPPCVEATQVAAAEAAAVEAHEGEDEVAPTAGASNRADEEGVAEDH